MAHVYISIGSNIDPEKNIRAAISDLRDIYGELEISTVYESEAVGFEGDNFLNLVVGLNTNQDVHKAIATLRQIEDDNGRVRKGPRFSSRTVDLDLLLYDDQDFTTAGLDIPRDEITKNAFVLLPLSELAPALVHPISGETMVELWNKFSKETQKLWPFNIIF